MKNRFALVGFTCFACFFTGSFLNAYFSFALFGLWLVVSVILIRLEKKTIAVAAITAAASFLIFGAYTSVFIEPCQALYGKVLPITGTVIEKNSPDNDTVSLVVSGSSGDIPLKLTLFTSDTAIETGDKIAFEAKLSEFRNNTNFSERDYNYSKGIFLRAVVISEIETTEKASFNPVRLITDYSEYLKGIISEKLQGDKGALLSAMFFGDKSRLSDELSSDIRRSGISHVTAVSGMHLSLIVTVILCVIGCLGLKGHNIISFCLVAVITLTFMVFFEMTPSVCRSGIMLIIYHGASAFRRKSSPLNSLGLAMLVIMLPEPYACRDTGLILSACGTIGAGVIAPAITVKFKESRFSSFKEAVTVSICASLATLPVSSVVFGGTSILSAVTSILIYPFFLVAVVAVLIFAFSGGILASPCLFAAGVASNAIIAICRILGGLDYSFISFSNNPLISAVILLSFGAVTILLNFLRKKNAVTVAAASVCVVITLILFNKLAMRNTSVISVLSDGSDCIMSVKTAEGITVIASDKNEKLGRYISDTLSEYNMNSIDLLCILNSEDDYFTAYSSLEYDNLHTPDKENTLYHINDSYSLTVKGSAAHLDINGNSFMIAPSGTEELSADFLVYYGYKKDFGNYGNNVTIFCDKKFYKIETTKNTINSYYENAEIHIDNNGNYTLH